MNNDDFMWLQNWYFNQCDGDWEHEFGIRIDTLDNPGWSIIINLEGTSLESKEFTIIKIQEKDENDWLVCRVLNHKFDAACGPTNLSKVLGIFRQWVEEHHELSQS